MTRESKSMTHIAKLVTELAVYTENEQGNMGAPLLSQLRRAVWGDTGRTAGGAGSKQRVLIDVDAFTLYEDVDGRLGEMFASATELRPHGAPAANLLAWWAVFSKAAEAGETELLQHEVAHERLERIAERIREHFDKPKRMALRGVGCPECGEYRVLQGHGELEAESDALVASIEAGEITVTCQVCESTWEGDTQVINLGRRVGVQLDVDAIRVARVLVPATPTTELKEES